MLQLPGTPSRIIRSGVLTIIAVAGLATMPARSAAQMPRVGIIDVYGTHKTSPKQIRDALGISVGDTLTGMTLLMVPAKLADLPGVASASVDPVCCEDGKTMLYVGVMEDGAPALELRPA